MCPEGLPRKIKQVSGTKISNNIIGIRNRQKELGQTKRKYDRVEQGSGGYASLCYQSGHASLRGTSCRNQDHVGARGYTERETGGAEQEECLNVHHLGAPRVRAVFDLLMFFLCRFRHLETVQRYLGNGGDLHQQSGVIKS